MRQYKPIPVLLSDDTTPINRTVNRQTQCQYPDPHPDRYWDTKAQQLLVNGKPGYSLALPYKDDKMICYAVAASDELVCNDSGNY